MALQVTLIKVPTSVAIAKTSHLFDQRGGTLGRSDANLWVLPDQEKFLSSCHSEIVYEAGRYFLMDLSTNGTFLNSAFEPIGKGSKTPLKNGDFFDIGEFRFSVAMTDDQPFAPAPASIFSAPLGEQDDLGFATPSTPFASNPFSASDLGVHDFSSGFGASQDPLAALERSGTSTSKDSLADIFGQPTEQAIGGASNFGRIPEDVGFSNSSLVDMSPSMDQAISWPSARAESLIPDDWEDDFFAEPKAKPTFESPIPKPTSPPVSRPLANTSPAPEKLFDTPAAFVDSNAGLAELLAKPVTVPPVTVQTVPTPVASVVESNSKSNAVLIEAMGLNSAALSAAEIDEISERVGLLMREVTEGMMQVLRSRTSIKNEFRMNVTTIQPVENNPLKFSVGVDEALENMFLKKTNAYKKPVEAFKEGFQEIGEHQVAMIAGIRHGFEAMMQRFNPEALETQFNKQGKGTVIPGMQRAKYWSSYCENYESFTGNMDSSFQHLFGSEFVSAYEEQLRKLSMSRKKAQ
jgi:type VI secretion system FHA domain protein